MDKDFEMSKNGYVDTCMGQRQDIFGAINVSLFFFVCGSCYEYLMVSHLS